MNLSDVFELTLHGEVLGETADLVFFVGPESFPGNLPPTGEAQTNEALQQLADAIVGSLISEAEATISDLYEIRSWRAYMLFDPVSLYAGLPTVAPPQFAGATALVSTFATYVVASPTKRRGQNWSYKRLPGVVEGAIEGGVIGSGSLASLQAAVDVWNAPIDTGVTLEWRVMWQMYNVKRVPITNQAGEVKGYRLPENVAEFAGYVIDNWAVQPRMSTQNSRKVGRGS